MSPVRAAPLFARIELPPLQGSSCSRPLPRPYSLGYDLKVSPSGLLVERLPLARNCYELKVSPSGLLVERLMLARNSYEPKASPGGLTLNTEDVKGEIRPVCGRFIIINR